MLAGYETISTALGYATYILATHPEEQQKLHKHIDAHFDPETEHTMPTYEIVSEMNYLDMFIRETLRIFPIVPIRCRSSKCGRFWNQRFWYCTGRHIDYHRHVSFALQSRFMEPIKSSRVSS